MPPDMLAPWAEPVPDVDSLAAHDLFALSEDTWLYELVEGRLVRTPPTGFDHGDLEVTLASELRAFARAHNLGRVVSGEASFHLSGSPPITLGEADTLDGGTVVPGFRYPVAHLFA